MVGSRTLAGFHKNLCVHGYLVTLLSYLSISYFCGLSSDFGNYYIYSNPPLIQFYFECCMPLFKCKAQFDLVWFPFSKITFWPLIIYYTFVLFKTIKLTSYESTFKNVCTSRKSVWYDGHILRLIVSKIEQLESWVVCVPCKKKQREYHTS